MDLKIVFMGTPEFSVPAMEAVYEKYGLSAVVTVPDKPSGRGLKLGESPVKRTALKYGIPILQPESLKDAAFIDNLASFEPDIICVIAFRILPKAVYELARIASFNVHASLLPKYRGAAPINHAIMKGETESGLSTFILQEKVDTGNILLQHSAKFPFGTSAGDLHDLLMNMSPKITLETIDLLKSGDFTPLKQNDTEATPAPKIFPQDCFIDWNKPTIEVLNQIYGLSPYPGARTNFNGQLLKIIYATASGNTKLQPMHYTIEGNRFLIACSDGAIALDRIIPEGKREMKAEDFLKGYRGDKTGILS
ncbi:MAG: methionyl-tRNA formyltransferase [Candidatus Kapabacteria bacterium]|nr:methionyl-tRNA formyltransferase [Candidatus Kapabacteria bacterium]